MALKKKHLEHAEAEGGAAWSRAGVITSRMADMFGLTFSNCGLSLGELVNIYELDNLITGFILRESVFPRNPSVRKTNRSVSHPQHTV